MEQKSLSLLSSSAIYKLISNLFENKVSVCPIIAPEDTASPFILYQRVSSNRLSVLGNASTEIRDVTYMISIVDISYEKSLSMADQLITLLDGYSGTVGECSILGIDILDDAEEFNSDAFIQSIKIKVKTTKV